MSQATTKARRGAAIVQGDMQALGETSIPNHNEKKTCQLVSRTPAAVTDREAIDGRWNRYALWMRMPITDIVQYRPRNQHPRGAF